MALATVEWRCGAIAARQHCRAVSPRLCPGWGEPLLSMSAAAAVDVGSKHARAEVAP